MVCTTERHVWYGSGSTSSTPIMNERCACGALKQGDISPLERLRAENERLRDELAFQSKNAQDAHAERAREWRRAADAREALANIVGAFTSGVYCANCGESVEDCDCPLNWGRVVLAD